MWCETLWADDTFLRNRRNPILIGEITELASPACFKVRQVPQEGGQRKTITLIDASGVTTEPFLPVGQRVCVHYHEGTGGLEGGSCKRTSDRVGAERVTPENKLVFLSGWYRRRLGIPREKIGSKNPFENN